MARPTNKIKHDFEEILKSPTGVAKFKRIMAATRKEETYLAYFKECFDRAFGKAAQFVDLDVNDNNPDRPTTEALIQTVTTLRAELDASRAGAGVEAGK